MSKDPSREPTYRPIHPIRILAFAIVVAVAGFASAEAQPDSILQISQRSLQFDTTCGASQCRTVVVRNVSDSVLTITQISNPGAPFAVDPASTVVPPHSIQPGDSGTIVFCFRPTQPELISGSIVQVFFENDTASSPFADTIRLDGQSRSASVSFDPPIIDFGNVTVGRSSCVQVTIENQGNQPIDLETLDSLLFPFSPASVPATSLAPGADIDVQICFEPISAGDYGDTLGIRNGGCREATTLSVRGSGLDSVANIGPVLQVVSVDFDTTLCGTTKCRNLTFRNVGTDPLTLSEVDDFQLPFSGSVSPLPATIQPDQERTFTVCYTPEEPDREDTLEVGVIADNRVSLSIATLFDVSGSMQAAFGSTTRIRAANDAGRSFLSNLINDPARGVVDEGAVYQFSAEGSFQRLAGYTDNIGALQAAVPNNAPGPQTCLYDAIVRVANELGNENQPGRRVMVVLADGDNSCPSATATINDAIDAANDAGVRVYTIRIGSANEAELQDIANSTGGFYSEAISPAELLQSYQQIANSLSRNQATTFTIRGESVAPELRLSQNSISFDSTRVGSSRCITLEVTNVGTAPLDLQSIIGPETNFTLDPASLPTIVPNATFGVDVCFEPERIRAIDSVILFEYSRCDARTDTVSLFGVGYDSVVVSLAGTRTARPGSTVSYPLTLAGRVPESYAVDSVSLAFQYNKTMLYPEPENAPVTGPEGLLLSYGESSSEFTFGSDTVVVNVALRDGRLVNESAQSNLGNVAFLVLHGNALTTDIELIGGQFADGNPKLGVTSNASFTADSLCFHAQRLINAEERIGLVARYNAGGAETADVVVDLPVDGLLSVGVFDRTGRQLASERSERGAGLYNWRFDTEGWPQGLYFVRVQLASDGRSDVKSSTIRVVR